MNLCFPTLQFYWRQTEEPGVPVNPVPDFLPFEFEFNEDLQLIKQKTSSIVRDSLERVYKEDFNVGYLDNNNSLASLYGNDFIDFLDKHINDDKKLKVLEIGCGKGYLLKHLHKSGHYVTGLDPSPSAQQKDSSIPVVPDFFPSKKIDGEWDVILHYDVLEHAEEAVAFLQAQRDLLTEKGRIIFAVPDCTNGIGKGDLSIILHEHINYFDLESVERVLNVSGFKSIETVRSDKVGTIYCVAVKSAVKNNLTLSNEKFSNFKNKIDRNISKINSIVSEAMINRQTVGFYIPLRFLPYLSQFENLDVSLMRFFDDSSAFKNRYFDGFKVVIESGEELKQKPVDVLLIGSYIFGKTIAQKFSHVPGMKNITIADLFEDS